MKDQPIILRHYIKDGTIEIDISDLVKRIVDEDMVTQLRTQYLLGINPQPQPMQVMVDLKFELTTDLELLFL